jgi:small basic protein
MPTFDTLIAAKTDTIFLIDTMFITNGLQTKPEVVLNSIAAIGTWVGISVGVFSIFVMVVIAFFGIKWFADRAAIRKEIQNAIKECREGFEDTSKQLIESATINWKTQLLLVWERHAALSTKYQDRLPAYEQVKLLAISLNDIPAIARLLKSISEFTKKNPEVVRTSVYCRIFITTTCERIQAYLATLSTIDIKDEASIQSIRDLINELKQPTTTP